jgi:hypothetical protein
MERFETIRRDGRCFAPAEGLTRHPLEGGVCKRRDRVREHIGAKALALNQWLRGKRRSRMLTH